MKRQIIIICITAALALSIAGCKKEGPPGPAGPDGAGGAGSPDPNLYAKWEVASGMGDIRYVILGSGNACHLLYADQYGFRGLASQTSLVTGSQVQLDDLYNYRISNDTMYLDNIAGTAVLVKNPNAPDASQWVLPITELASYPSPVSNGDGRQDLGFDGTHILWTADYSVNSIYKINPATGAVAGTVPLATTYYYGQVNYAATSIWIADNQTHVIDRLNPATGAVISTSPVLSQNQIKGMALCGQKFWYTDWLGTTYTWDIVTNAITPELQYRADGMEYVNGYLYISQNRMIHKCQVSPFAVLASYSSGNANVNYEGITHDGTNFWAVKYDQTANDYFLTKLSF